MMEVSTIILWVVTLIVIAILVAACIYMLSQKPENIVPPPGYVPPLIEPPFPAQYDYACFEDSDCDKGLSCDTILGECKSPENGKCRSSADCISGLYCSGICIDPNKQQPNLVTSSPGDPCPCQFGYSCITNSDSTKTCLKRTGVTCSADDECISGVCYGTCFEGFDNGFKCTGDNQCLSGNCSNGFCQSAGIKTSELGSNCRPGTPDCEQGLVCSVNNICVPATNGLTLSCDQTRGCPNYFTCYNIPVKDSNGNYPAPGSPGGFDLCAPDGTGCVCLFTTDRNTVFPRPNLASEMGAACLPTYVPDVAGQYCLAPENQPCTANKYCQSGNCSSGSKIYQMQFEYNSSECAPVSGTIGETNQTFVELPSFTFPVMKLIGDTMGYKPPTDFDCTGLDAGTDSVYVISYGGPSELNINPSTTALWKLKNGTWFKILSYHFVDSLGNDIRFTDADVTEFNGKELLLVTGVDIDTDKDKLFTVDLDALVISPYITSDGRQVKNDGDHFNFDSISITDVQENSNYPGILLNYSSGNLHYNNTGNKFKSLDSLSGADPNYIQLSYGMSKDSKGVTSTYPIITYVSGGGSNRFVRFTSSLSNNVSNMKNITYPPALNGMSLSDVTVYGYSMSKSNPVTDASQNGYFVANVGGNQGDIAIYTISSGLITAIPGYLDGNALLLSTKSNFYFYTSKYCI